MGVLEPTSWVLLVYWIGNRHVYCIGYFDRHVSSTSAFSHFASQIAWDLESVTKEAKLLESAFFKFRIWVGEGWFGFLKLR